uniref:Uncharacterized protein n=1 Tax=Cacopsylla melanoneura TaxID=428564 RepID=A0A8D9ETI7_9HEMI
MENGGPSSTHIPKNSSTASGFTSTGTLDRPSPTTHIGGITGPGYHGTTAPPCGSTSCRLHPTIVVLLCTLLCTSCATGMLCAAIITDHWEYVHWNRTLLEQIATEKGQSANSKGLQISIESYLDGLVTKLIVRNFAKPRPLPKHHASSYAHWLALNDPHWSIRSDGAGEGYAQWLVHSAAGGGYREPLSVVSTVFLVPMHGGIWTMCVFLTEEQISLLENVGFLRTRCTNYLYPEFDVLREDDVKADWQHRMQNLSISCALVCLIILGSSALVGSFGVLKHQISAVLVTGVMYLLAAFFALFTLTIIHFKRAQTKHKPINYANCIGRSPDGTEVLLVDGVIQGMSSAASYEFSRLWVDFYKARVFTVGWSLDLGWGGVTLCVLTSIFWILLSKMMRYNPIVSQTQPAGGGGGQS